MANVVYSLNHCIYWIRSHANELLAEVATEIKDPKAVNKFVSHVTKDWTSEKTPGKMLETDVKNLLNLGLSKISVT